MSSTSVADKLPTETARDYLVRQFNERRWLDLPTEARPRVVRAASAGRHVFLAIRYPAAYFAATKTTPSPHLPNDDGSVVAACVIGTHSHVSSRSGCTFSYREESEVNGPRRTGAPLVLLDLLSGLDDSEQGRWAHAWRVACRTAIATRSEISASARRVQAGDMIVLSTPVTFRRAGEVRVFRVRAGSEKYPYETESGLYCRFPKRHLRDARVFRLAA